MPICPKCQTSSTKSEGLCTNCGSPLSVVEETGQVGALVQDAVVNHSSVQSQNVNVPVNVTVVPYPTAPVLRSELIHCKVCGLLLESPKWRCPECESYVCEQHYLPDEFMCLRCLRKREVPMQAPKPAPAVPVVPPAPELTPWERVGSRAGEEVTGPDSGAYVWVPAGEFMMGSNDGEAYEKPVHKVRLTRGFWLGKHTVTNAQYFDYCASTRRVFPAVSQQGDDHPVVVACWDDAMAYCHHYGLSLATEAEWEYAARGDEGRKYPWGNDWDAGKCCNEANHGPGGQTFPVGSFPTGASWCGALDMAGNVWEWCSDGYGSEYYKRSPASDPSGAEDSYARVLRGGAWTSKEHDCRSAARLGWYLPIDRLVGVGFRCVARPKPS